VPVENPEGEAVPSAALEFVTWFGGFLAERGIICNRLGEFETGMLITTEEWDTIFPQVQAKALQYGIEFGYDGTLVMVPH
jgi:hypothetical protein